MSIGKAITGFADKWVGRASNIWTFVGPLTPGTLGAIVTGELSTTVSWISQYGVFGWWCAALVGGFCTTGLYVLTGYGRVLAANSAVRRRWAKDVDDINPMDTNFDRKRFKVSDVAHPISRKISEKTFVNCEIIGPQNIVLNNTSFNGVSFQGCDIVIVLDSTYVKSVAIFDSCHLIGGSVWNCTIFTSQDDYNHMKARVPGFLAITYERP